MIIKDELTNPEVIFSKALDNFKKKHYSYVLNTTETFNGEVVEIYSNSYSKTIIGLIKPNTIIAVIKYSEPFSLSGFDVVEVEQEIAQQNFENTNLIFLMYQLLMVNKRILSSRTQTIKQQTSWKKLALFSESLNYSVYVVENNNIKTNTQVIILDEETIKQRLVDNIPATEEDSPKTVITPIKYNLLNFTDLEIWNDFHHNFEDVRLLLVQD